MSCIFSGIFRPDISCITTQGTVSQEFLSVANVALLLLLRKSSVFVVVVVFKSNHRNVLGAEARKKKNTSGWKSEPTEAVAQANAEERNCLKKKKQASRKSSCLCPITKSQ